MHVQVFTWRMNTATISNLPLKRLPPLVLDRQEAAQALRISLRKLDLLIQHGEIAATRIDGRVLVAWSDLKSFVAKKRNPQEAVGS